ncbi:MAG: glycosyltransferase [Desulfamplus sp.]|nr:glycosyltransferase [Desulfamplus sp.]
MLNEDKLIPYKEFDLPKGGYLVFAPHPDDETLGMGGTIILAAKFGIDVNIVFVTDGEKGGNPHTRKIEAKAAAKILGVKEIFYLNLPDRDVAFMQFPEQTLLEILEKVKPATIFLPSFQEIHPDHRATTHSFLSFLDKVAKYRFDDRLNLSFELWFYEINRQGEVNRLIDISYVLDIKEAAIDCYASQLEQLDYKIHALCLNCMRSVTLGDKTNYVEGFWCHDAKEGITPEEYYFSRLFDYKSNPLKQHYSKDSDQELRALRVNVNELASKIKNYLNFINYLGQNINDKANEIKRLKDENSKYIELTNQLERQISDISLSKSHKIASYYIKSVVKLRGFLGKFKKNRTSAKAAPFPNFNPFDELFDDTDLKIAPIQITDEPIIRLYSKDEMNAKFSSQYDQDLYYLDISEDSGQDSGHSKVQPLFNDKPVAFSINCTKDNLASIELFMATYMRVNSGILTLSIYKDCNYLNLIGTSRVIAPTIMDNSFVTFSFEPIEDSKGKIFYATLALTGGFGDICPCLWLNSNPKIDELQKYHQWIEKNENISSAPIKDEINDELNFLNIAVIIPLIRLSSPPYHNQNSNLEMLEQTFESVLNQSYQNFQMVIIDSNPSDLLSDYDKSKLDNFYSKYSSNPKITFINITTYNIAKALNRAVEIIADCRYFLLLEPFDKLSLNALYECIKVLNQLPNIDFIYSDEDKISTDGVRFNPFFKPDWSPNLILSGMYVGSLALYKKDIFQNIGGFSQENQIDIFYDAVLRLSELTHNMAHIPKILYHRRYNILKEANRHKFQQVENEKSLKTLQAAIRRKGLKAKLYQGQTSSSFRLSYRFDPKIVISIIVPFKDNHDLLHTCIKSILQKSSYRNYEIICVNNQSKDRDKFMDIESCGFPPLRSIDNLNLTLLDYDEPFNYSAINNFAVKHSKGEMLLFLNSDTEVISEDWLEAMLEHASRDNVGAVGAKLYYVNDTIQHAGIVVGVAGVAGHAFKQIKRSDINFYHGFACMLRDVSAVTGACMMLRRSVFEEVGGFDEEHFKISYNDLDLCLKMRQRGYDIIYTPFAELYHYESYSRGYSFDAAATENIKAKWGDYLKSDTFYNPNLTKSKEDWSLK